METVANVSLAVGLAALVGGTLMIIFGGPDEPSSEEASASPLVGASPGGGIIGVQGTF
jgi:hypothetical protein